MWCATLFALFFLGLPDRIVSDVMINFGAELDWSNNEFHQFPQDTNGFSIGEQQIPTGEVKTTVHPINSKPKYDREVVKSFASYVCIQTVKAFFIMKKSLQGKHMGHQIDMAISAYKLQLMKYVVSVQKQDPKTLETQNTILRTVDASKTIAKRLVDNLRKYLRSETQNSRLHGDTKDADTEFLEQLIDNTVETQYVRACEVYGACRSRTRPEKPTFIKIVTDCLENALQVNSMELRKAHQEFVAAVRRTDFTPMVGDDINAHIQRQNKQALRWKTGEIRPKYTDFLSHLKTGERPLIAVDVDEIKIEEPIALLQLLDIISPRIEATKTIQHEWRDMKIIVAEWAAGHRFDLKNIIKMFIFHMLRNASTKTTRAYNY